MTDVPAPHVYVHEPGVWSSSLLKLYLECPFAWWMSANSTGTDRGVEAPVHWRRGTVAHAAMEAAYNARLRAGAAVRVGRGTTMELFFPDADAALHRSWLGERMPDDPPMLEQVREDVRVVLASLPVPRVENILGVELELRTKVGRFPVRSYLDLALRVGPDAVHIRDWKTFSTLPTVQELREGIQLPLYGLQAKRAFPWAKRVSVSIYSIPSNSERVVTLTDADLMDIERRVRDIATEAETDEVCTPTPSAWCDSCQVKPVCPVWNPAVSTAPGMDAAGMTELRSALREVDGF